MLAITKPRKASSSERPKLDKKTKIGKIDVNKNKKFSNLKVVKRKKYKKNKKLTKKRTMTKNKKKNISESKARKKINFRTVIEKNHNIIQEFFKTH